MCQRCVSAGQELAEFLEQLEAKYPVLPEDTDHEPGHHVHVALQVCATERGIAFYEGDPRGYLAEVIGAVVGRTIDARRGGFVRSYFGIPLADGGRSKH